MILVHPPVAKPGEPPAGIARLSGALNAHGIRHTVLDANLEGLLFLLKSPQPAGTDDSWTRRSFRNAARNISLVKDPETYRNQARYTRAIRELGRVLECVSGKGGAAGLANYQDAALSPLKSRDLATAAEQPESNIFYPYFRSRLSGLIHERQPAMIGFSLNYLSQAVTTFAMIGFVRREFPGIRIALGGGLVTSWMSSPTWQDPFSGLVDHCVAGCGEKDLLSLMGADAQGRFYTPDYQAMPAGEYLSPGAILPYSASTGCYWNRCAFCPEKAEGSPYIPVPADRVLSDLAALASRTDPVLIHLLDSAVSANVMQRLSMEGPGIPWYGFARLERQLTDPDFCSSLKRSGCVMLKLGLESGDQEVLDRMGKGISLDTASEALKALKKAGIAAYVYLIFGTPAEDLQGARRTLEFVSAHAEQIGFLNLAIFNMPVCNADSSGLETKKFSEGDLSLYTDFIHPRGWDRREVRRFLDAEFRRNPAVSQILKNDPIVFTSNHAPFFVMKKS